MSNVGHQIFLSHLDLREFEALDAMGVHPSQLMRAFMREDDLQGMENMMLREDEEGGCAIGGLACQRGGGGFERQRKFEELHFGGYK